MKLKRIVAGMAAIIMMSSIGVIGASAYNLYYAQGAPTSDINLNDDSYYGGYYGQLNKVIVHSNSFSRLLPYGSVYAENVNSGNHITFASTGDKTINTNIYLNGAMVHNYYELRSYIQSKSISAYGTDQIN